MEYTKIILLLAIALSLLALTNVVPISEYFRSITAKVNEVLAKGGYVTELNLQGVIQTSHWQSIYGNVSTDSGTEPPVTIIAFGGNSSEIDVRYRHDTGYIFITTIPSEPDYSNLVAGNIGDVDAITGIGSDSGTNTFRQFGNFTFKGITIVNAPLTYTFVNHEIQNTSYPLWLLNDGKSTIFATKIETNQVGFDGKTRDYQAMLPVPSGSGKTYYLYVRLEKEPTTTTTIPRRGVAEGAAAGEAVGPSCTQDITINLKNETKLYQSPDVIVLGFKIPGSLKNTGTCSLVDVGLSVSQVSGTCDFDYSVLPTTIPSISVDSSQAFFIVLSAPKSWEPHSCKLRLDASASLIKKSHEFEIYVQQELPANITAIRETMLEVSLNIVKKQITEGQDLDFLLKLTPHFKPGENELSVSLLYLIKNFTNGEVVSYAGDDVVVERDMSLTKSIPYDQLNATLGKYALEVVATYQDKTISAADIFEVVSLFNLIYLFVALAGAALLLIVLLIYKRRKRMKSKYEEMAWKKLYKKWRKRQRRVSPKAS